MIASILISIILCIQPERTGTVEPFPGVVVDYDTRTVEVEGFVPVDVSHDETPDVRIELIAESHGVRDFEALISLNTDAKNIHAALLMLGIEPGSPGRIEVDQEAKDRPMTRVDPTGPELLVRFRFERSGETVIEDPTEWVFDPETDQIFSEIGPRFYFGGSSFREFAGQEWYMARAEGTVVGLCTFGTTAGGTETVGCTPVLSPHEDTGDPVWHTINGRIPPFGTKMTLLLTAVDVPTEDTGKNPAANDRTEE